MFWLISCHLRFIRDVWSMAVFSSRYDWWQSEATLTIISINQSMILFLNDSHCLSSNLTTSYTGKNSFTRPIHVSWACPFTEEALGGAQLNTFTQHERCWLVTGLQTGAQMVWTIFLNLSEVHVRKVWVVVSFSCSRSRLTRQSNRTLFSTLCLVETPQTSDFFVFVLNYTAHSCILRSM